MRSKSAYPCLLWESRACPSDIEPQRSSRCSPCRSVRPRLSSIPTYRSRNPLRIEAGQQFRHRPPQLQGKQQINHANTCVLFHEHWLDGKPDVSRMCFRKSALTRVTAEPFARSLQLMQTRKMTCAFSAGLLAMLAVATGPRWDGPVRAAAEKQLRVAQYCIPQGDDPSLQRLYCPRRGLIGRVSLRGGCAGQRGPRRQCRRAARPAHGSFPYTWVTVYCGDMGNTFGRSPPASMRRRLKTTRYRGRPP